jgi:hypothetical protein
LLELPVLPGQGGGYVWSLYGVFRKTGQPQGVVQRLHEEALNGTFSVTS